MIIVLLIISMILKIMDNTIDQFKNSLEGSQYHLLDPEKDFNISSLKFSPLSDEFSITNQEEYYDHTFMISQLPEVGQGDQLTKNVRMSVKSSPASTGTKKKLQTKKKLSPTKRIGKENKEEQSDEDEPKNPKTPYPEKRTESTNTSRYQRYIESSDFQTDKLIDVLNNCALYSEDEEINLNKFWKRNITYLIQLLDDGNYSTLSFFKTLILKGLVAMDMFVEGVKCGISIGKSQVNQSIVHQLGNLHDSLNSNYDKVRKEALVHQKQTLEFINQMTNASKVISDFQSSVEQIKLIATKTELLPTSLLTPKVSLPSKRLEDFEISTDDSETKRLYVKEINEDGFFQSSKLNVRLQDNQISSIGIIDVRVKNLSCLIGKPSAFGFLILNLDLNAIIRKILLNPNWLTRCFESNKPVNKTLLHQDLKGLKKTYYQWTRGTLSSEHEEGTSDS